LGRAPSVGDQWGIAELQKHLASLPRGLQPLSRTGPDHVAWNGHRAAGDQRGCPPAAHVLPRGSLPAGDLLVWIWVPGVVPDADLHREGISGKPARHRRTRHLPALGPAATTRSATARPGPRPPEQSRS